MVSRVVLSLTTSGLNQTVNSITQAVAKIVGIQSDYLLSHGWTGYEESEMRVWSHPSLTLGTKVPIKTALQLQRHSEN
jgi:hypothetical protein